MGADTIVKDLTAEYEAALRMEGTHKVDALGNVVMKIESTIAETERKLAENPPGAFDQFAAERPRVQSDLQALRELLRRTKKETGV